MSNRRYPKVGDWAHHRAGLDPREVVAVKDEGGLVQIKLDILGQTTVWLDAINYEFEEAR